MSDERPLIVVAGDSLIDRIVRSDGAVEEVPGGGPFNTARALARLGCRVAFLGRLSTDRYGAVLRVRLVDDGVDLSLAPSTADPTLVAIAELDADGVASYRFEPPDNAAAGLATGDIPSGLPKRTAALHVGTLGLVFEPMATTLAGLVAAAREDILVVADPNIRPAAIADAAAYRERLARLVPRVDVLKVSVDDLRWLAPSRDPLAAARRLADSGPSLVLVTDGPRPVIAVRRSGAAAFVDVPAVDVVDTIGAGDAFSAAFLARWMGAGRGRGDLADLDAVVDATRFAVRAAAWTVSRRGADPPHLADLGLGPDPMP